MTTQQQVEQQIINLSLTVAEINVILRSLGKHPFEEIAALIAKIKQQGERQIAELNNAEAELEGESIDNQ